MHSEGTSPDQQLSCGPAAETPDWKELDDAAMAKIDQAEAQALAEVREAAVELAVAATRTMLVDNLDRARGDALIDTAIGELRRKLH